MFCAEAGKFKWKREQGLLILHSSASSIHMMFMNFPIDALFLDSEKRIVDIAENLQPWVLNFTPKKPAKFIIEMKAGLAKKFKLKADGKMVF